jgi:hypothetical protein
MLGFFGLPILKIETRWDCRSHRITGVSRHPASSTIAECQLPWFCGKRDNRLGFKNADARHENQFQFWRTRFVFQHGIDLPVHNQSPLRSVDVYMTRERSDNNYAPFIEFAS